MICATVEIREGAVVRRARLTATSIKRALKLAGGGKPGRKARLVFPIDSETFFVPGGPGLGWEPTDPRRTNRLRERRLRERRLRGRRLGGRRLGGRRTLRRRTQTPVSFWQCGHFSPVLVEEVEGGKSARCLLCGERGPVREVSEEALGALRDRARQRDEAQSA